MLRFRCFTKILKHTNPDGSTIDINSLDIESREFYHEESKEWIKVETKLRAEKHKNIQLPKLKNS